MFQSYLQKQTPACSCMSMAYASFFGHYYTILHAHVIKASTKILYVLASENIKRVHANTSMRGLANVVSSLMHSHALHVITMHVCTRTDNVASRRVS